VAGPIPLRMIDVLRQTNAGGERVTLNAPEK
jgi:hypothetical protein